MQLAVELSDIDYEIWIQENAVFFEMWKGALTHDQLCKMSFYTRLKYIEELNKIMKIKEQARKEAENA